MKWYDGAQVLLKINFMPEMGSFCEKEKIILILRDIFEKKQALAVFGSAKKLLLLCQDSNIHKLKV